MPGFEDSALIVLIALLLFGPKKLPELARQFGKLMADFRRASSEFRTQMEDELRISEQAERQKKIAAESAATSASNSAALPAATAETSAGNPAQDSPSEYTDQDLPYESSLDSMSDSEFESSSDYPLRSSHDSPSDSESELSLDYPLDSSAESAFESAPESTPHSPPDDPWQSSPNPAPETLLESTAHPTAQPASSPLPIATIGEMSILPPSTGLPTPHTASEPLSDTVPIHREASETEALHG